MPTGYTLFIYNNTKIQIKSIRKINKYEKSILALSHECIGTNAPLIFMPRKPLDDERKMS